ncbi:MAG: LytR family transcriptional regulator [Candidatus Moranbacteria bacterium]|nr:LytR family transcriptional regulator [Candidatus Moranbacteria bacterium]
MLRKKWKYLILSLVLLPLLAVAFTAGYFLHRIWLVSRVITVKNEPVEEQSVTNGNNNFFPSFSEPVEDLAPEVEALSVVSEETKNEYRRQYGLLEFAKEKISPARGSKERINLLLLGKAVPGYPGSDLTDTIILASINPVTYQASMLSIPRDLYVAIPGTKRYTKINAIYVYGLKLGGHQKGIELLKQAVAAVTGQKVDYYMMVNFSAFEQGINTLNGVEVDVPESIYDNRYPGPNYSYQTFAIEKGPHHLDGATALKYVRVRHAAGGDFGRARRQQQVIEAAKNKFFEKRGLKESLSFFNEILKIIQANVKTDVEFTDYFPFLLLLKDINVNQVVNRVLDNTAEGLLEDYNPAIQGIRAYTLRPRAGNYYEIHKVAAYILHLDRMERQEKARAEEKSRVVVMSAPNFIDYRERVERILRGKGYQVDGTGYGIENVNLWQRRSGAKLPAVSKENRGKLSAEPLVEKIVVNPGALKQTVIYDNAEGRKPFSLDDLARRLGGQISLYKEANIEADFVIILGENVKQVFQKEEEGEFFLTDEGMEQEKAENSQ